MKIGILTASISRRAGGLLGAVRPLAEGVQKAGCEVTVFSIYDEFAAEDAEQWQGVKLRLSPRRGPAAYGYAPELRNNIDSEGLALLHAHGLWMYPSVAASRWSKRWRRPHIVSPHGMLDPWAIRNSAWKKRLAGVAFEDGHLRRAACIHALCDAELKAIRQYGISNPVAVIPNGIDPPNLNVHSLRRDICQSPSDERKTLLFLGRIHPKKGLVNLLNAWTRVQKRASKTAKEWRVVIVGWEQGNHQAELQALVEEAGIADSVFFLGPRFGEEKARILTCADAFVLPSFSEGLPMAVLEAWSYYLPVLMTPQCNLPEGFVAEAAIEMAPEVDSIVHGLAKLFGLSDAERNQMGINGRELVEKHFTWSIVSKQMCEVYAWVLGQGPMPECVNI